MEDTKREALTRAVLEAGFGDGASLNSLRERLGIPPEDWEEWLREGLLTEDVVAMARAEAGVYAPRVWASLLALADDGNVQAIKLYFELWKGERHSGGLGPGVGSEMTALRREVLGEPDRERGD